jgi:hypothetical protein
VTSDVYNNVCAENLKAFGFEDRIAVIGSGPSCPFITSIDELVKRLQSGCNVRLKPKEFHWDFFERAFRKNPKGYFQSIKQSFGDTPEWDARAYRHLAEIHFKSFVTLNYDDQLPIAFRYKHGTNFSELFRVYPTLGVDKFFFPNDLCGHKQRLVAIHGYRNDQDPSWHKNLVLNVSDYNRHYGDGTQSDGKKGYPELFGWWHALLTSQPCVFIGTSLQEPGIYNVVQELRKDGNPDYIKQNHIHLKHTSRLNNTPFYEPPRATIHGIQQVLYDKIDAKFSGLLDVLSAFSNIPTSRPVPMNPKRTPIMMDANYDFSL